MVTHADIDDGSVAMALDAWTDLAKDTASARRATSEED
jgi:hypothetical protein